MEIHDTLRNDNGFEQPRRVEKRESLSSKSRQAFRIISLFFYFSLSLSFASRCITRRSKFYSYLNFLFKFPANPWTHFPFSSIRRRIVVRGNGGRRKLRIFYAIVAAINLSSVWSLSNLLKHIPETC